MLPQGFLKLDANKFVFFFVEYVLGGYYNAGVKKRKVYTLVCTLLFTFPFVFRHCLSAGSQEYAAYA